MKIAFIYDAVYPWETGGVQKRVWELARRLADDHEVHWYGLHYWDGPRVYETEGVTLHGVGAPRPLYVDGRRSITEALTFSAQLIGPLRRGQYDIIDCQAFPYFPAFPAKLASVLQDATLLVTWHEVWSDYWYTYLGRKGVFGKLVEHSVARLPDANISVSERTRTDLQTLGVTSDTVVPNGIEMTDIEAAAPADEQIDVLFVGRLIEEKNPALVVRALARIIESQPDVRGWLVGEGPQHDRVTGLIDDLDLSDRVTVTGFRESHAEILGLMKAADVFVLPSRREGFGMTVLEALACGTPAVTIDHPQNAATELVEDEVTGAIAVETPASVADGIRRARAEVSSQDCIAVAREYEWDRIVTDLEAAYRQARSPE